MGFSSHNIFYVLFTAIHFVPLKVAVN